LKKYYFNDGIPNFVIPRLQSLVMAACMVGCWLLCMSR